MLFPNAMKVLDCLSGHGKDPPFWAEVTIELSGVVCLLYLLIAFRWAISFRHSGIQLSLVAVFLLCALCGYLPTILAVWHPDFAYTMRAALLIVLVFSCIVFLIVSTGKVFDVSATDQRLGKRLRQAVNDDDDERVALLLEEVRQLKQWRDAEFG